MDHDALGAHACDELGISETMRARPIQAALASAGSFKVGARMPLFVTVIAPNNLLTVLVATTSLVFLAVLGGLAAHVGGASVYVGTARVRFWGAIATAVTAGVSALFGAGCLSTKSFAAAQTYTTAHAGRNRLRKRLEGRDVCNNGNLRKRGQADCGGSDRPTAQLVGRVQNERS